MYNPSTNKWKLVAEMQTARDSLAVGANSCHGQLKAECVYAVGGQDLKGAYLSSAEQYSP